MSNDLDLTPEAECAALSAWNLSRYNVNAQDTVHPMFLDAFKLGFGARSTAAQPAEPIRPDLLERLSYHALERDDLSIEDAVSYLAEGWARVPGRTERQMVMQILALLAAAPAASGDSTPPSAPTFHLSGAEQRALNRALKRSVKFIDQGDPIGALRPEPEAAGQDCHGLDTPERVRFYEHDFYVLSNFSAFTLQWKGHRFDTSEAAYHWEKFSGDSGAAQLTRHFILTAPSAHEAFKIAEHNKPHRRADWDDVKVDIMREILRAKAQQHEYVRRKLLATGDRELVEDSWRDSWWGWGPDRQGLNMLGKLWMEVRAELRAASQQADREAE